MNKEDVLSLVRDCIAGTISYTNAKKLVEEKFKSTNTRIMQILKNTKEKELKILPEECTSETVKRYQDILNEIYDSIVQTGFECE